MASTVDLTVSGMNCAACVSRVERALLRVPGIETAEVNLARGTARVRGKKVAPAALLAALTGAGYDGSFSIKPAAPEPFPWLPLLLAVPLLINMATMAAGSTMLLPGWTQAAIALPVLVWGGWDLHLRAVRSLWHGAATMDLLVVLGADAAYGLSLWRLLDNPETSQLYFESGALIIAFVRLGRWLEARARRRTAGALDRLLALRPDTARKLSNGAETIVPAASLRIGDQVALKPGERAPADLKLVRGEALFDLSLLTGESLPAAQRPGDAIPEGAINLDGDLVLAVSATGDATRLARIVQLVTGAQSAKPPIQHILDRVSAVFVPAVILLALITWGGWLLHGANPTTAMVNAISVLVIACPCALGLAAPVAIMAGTGVAARYGILIRDPAALEQAAAIKTVAFDKTGTLTEGAPALAHVSGDEALILPIATALSRGSEHPLARAIRARGIAAPTATEFRSLAGQGVRGIIDGAACLLGSARLMAENHIDLAPFAGESARAETAGESVSFVARAGVLLGYLSFADLPRPRAAAAIAALQCKGIAVAMLTGDNQGAARAIGTALGIGRIEAALSPEQKLDRLNAMKSTGKLAMVGDGVNDAPALAAADLAIAMGSGSDIAIETAAITLMRPDLALVPAALDIARRTQTVLRQGLGWALLYNVIAIPLAALGHLSPIIAAAAMAGSSLSVVLNALRLNLWKPAP
jgi:Cu+-exporting ATPase